MTPSPFAVHSTPRYERLSNKLSKTHREFAAAEQSAITILSTDPYNRTRRYQIKKLEGVPVGEGQYRLSVGRWRFRYDIWVTTQRKLNAQARRRAVAPSRAPRHRLKPVPPVPSQAEARL